MTTEPGLRVTSPADWTRYVRDLSLPATTKLVALMIATYADVVTDRDKHKRAGENIYVSHTKLAHACGLGASTVRRHLTILRRLYLLERTRTGSSFGDGRADRHRLTIPTDSTTRFESMLSTTSARQ